MRSVDKYQEAWYSHTFKIQVGKCKEVENYYFKNVTVFLKATTPSVTGIGQALSNATGLLVTVTVAPIQVRTVLTLNSTSAVI
jgi:hypothetical protein